MKLSLIIAISLFAVSLPGQAATLSLESCAAIEHPVERLACYDTLAGRLPADTAKASGAAPNAVDPVGPKTGVMMPDAPAVTPIVPTVEPTIVAPAVTPTFPAVEPTPDAPAVTPIVPAVKPTPDAEAIFGLEHKQKPEDERPDRLQLKWTTKKKDAYGKWVITLENGQVWRQTDSTRFSFKNSEQWVVVVRGFMGSYFLEEPEHNKRIRVKRVK